MSLGDNAYFQQSLADVLGIERNPATAEGNLMVKNLSKNEKFANWAKQLGLDPSAVYLRAGSVLLNRMQGEDFDGDINDILSLAGGTDPEFARIMTQVYEATEKRYQD